MVCHDAAAESGKASCGSDTFTGRTCDGEGGVTFAAKSDARIRGRVLDENGGLNSLCKSGKVVDVLGVHVRRVTVAMLCLDRQINCFVDVLDTNDAEDGHHQLFLNEGMVEINLCNSAADLGTDVDTDLCEDDASVTAYAVTVDRVRDLAGLL